MAPSTFLNYSSAACGFVAAGFWLASARVEIPSEFSVTVVQVDQFVENPMGGPNPGHFPGTGRSPQLNALGEALGRQSRLSAAGAWFAGAAAILQALAQSV